jgi:hypothetical protein
MKHVKFLASTPPAFSSLEKRIADLGRSREAWEKFALQISADEADANRRFNGHPTLENARAVVNAEIVKRRFMDGLYLQSAHTACAHSQSAMKRAADSFAVYIPILSKVADLIQDDISATRAAIVKSLSEIDADVEVDSVKPLPSLLYRLNHVRSLLDIIGDKPNSNRTDSLVDQVCAVIRGELPDGPHVHVSRAQQGFPAGYRLPGTLSEDVVQLTPRPEPVSLTHHPLAIEPPGLTLLRQRQQQEAIAVAKLQQPVAAGV